MSIPYTFADQGDKQVPAEHLDANFAYLLGLAAGVEWAAVLSRPSNLSALSGSEVIQNAILQAALLGGSVIPQISTQVQGQGTQATLNFTAGTSAPTSPQTKDQWLDTNTTPAVLKVWNGAAWVIATPTNTNQLTDGAYLGQTALWNSVSSRPNNLTTLTGSEAIQNTILQYALLGGSVVPYVSSYITGQGTQAVLNFTVGTSAPPSPQVKDQWLDTNYSPPLFKTWNGSAWVSATPNNTNQLTDGAALGQTAVWNSVGSRPSNLTTLTGAEAIQNTILQAALLGGTVVPHIASYVNGQGTQATLNFTVGNSAPSSPQVSDQWLDTNYSPPLSKTWTGSTWIVSTPTDTTQLHDGANLGLTALWNSVSSRPNNLTTLTGSEAIQNAILQSLLTGGSVVPYLSSYISGQGTQAVLNFTVSTSPPSSPQVKDQWLDTNYNPALFRFWNGSAWVVATPTNTNQLADGANLGQTATWSLIGSRPYNLTQLGGGEAIQNAILQGNLTSGSVIPYLSSYISGQGTQAVLNFTTGSTAPSSPQVKDQWLDTNYSPALFKFWNGFNWVVATPTNTNQLADGANLGQTASWTLVGSRPYNLTQLGGGEAIQNAILQSLLTGGNVIPYIAGQIQYQGALATLNKATQLTYLSGSVCIQGVIQIRLGAAGGVSTAPGDTLTITVGSYSETYTAVSSAPGAFQFVASNSNTASAANLSSAIAAYSSILTNVSSSGFYVSGTVLGQNIGGTDTFGAHYTNVSFTLNFSGLGAATWTTAGTNTATWTNTSGPIQVALQGLNTIATHGGNMRITLTLTMTWNQANGMYFGPSLSRAAGSPSGSSAFSQTRNLLYASGPAGNGPLTIEMSWTDTGLAGHAGNAKYNFQLGGANYNPGAGYGTVTVSGYEIVFEEFIS